MRMVLKHRKGRRVFGSAVQYAIGPWDYIRSRGGQDFDDNFGGDVDHGGSSSLYVYYYYLLFG